MAKQSISMMTVALLTTLALGWNCQLEEHHLCSEISSYIVLIDAGSTGSRIFVYHYPPRMIEAQALPYIVKQPLTLPTYVGSYSKRPGITSFASNPSNISGYLHDLVMNAKEMMLKHDPKASIEHVPLYFGATAGLRSLTDHSSDHLMAHVRSYFSSDDCPFDFSRKEQARVISGEEEGVFGWLANNNAKNGVSASSDTTFGLLDMGGASAQIAFIPKEPSILANFFPIHVGQFSDGPIHLYTHSFQGYGYVLAFQRVCKKLLALSDGIKFENPCLSRGLTWNVTSQDFGVSIAEANVVTADGPIQMIGTGDFSKCHELAKTLLWKSECFVQPCSILGVYQPDFLDSKFIAVGEYGKAHSLAKIANPTPSSMLDTMHEGGIDYCKLSDAQQKGINSGKPITCWIAVWTYTFLTDGLGFGSSNSLAHMPSEPDWTWGQAIYEVNRFPYRLVQSVSNVGGFPITENVWWLTSPQFGLIILGVAMSSALISGMATMMKWRESSAYPVPPHSLRKHLLDV